VCFQETLCLETWLLKKTVYNKQTTLPLTNSIVVFGLFDNHEKTSLPIPLPLENTLGPKTPLPLGATAASA
jgi:hypothetical protein